MWDRATVFSFGTETEKLLDRRRKQFGRCSRKIPVGTIFEIPGREEAGLCVGDAWGCGSLKCSGRTSGTEKVWSRNPVSDFSGQKYWDERLIKLCNLAEEAGTKVRVMEMDTIFCLEN